METSNNVEITPIHSSSDEAASENPGVFACLKGRNKKKRENNRPDKDDAAPVSLPLLPFKDLFRFTSTIEKVYMTIACIAAAAHGGIMPVWTIIFGRVIKTFGSADAKPQNVVDIIGGVSKWFLVLAVISGVLSAIQVRFLMVVASRTSIRIRKLYFNSLMRQDKSWYDHESSGELTSRVATDVDIIQAGIGEKVGIAVKFLSQGLVGFVLAFVYSWKLAFVILACTPLLAICNATFSRFSIMSRSDGQGAYGSAGAIASEVVSLMRTVHAFGGQTEEARRYDEKLNVAYRSGVIGGFINGTSLGLTMFFMMGSYALSFWFGARLIKQGEIDVQRLFVAFFSILVGAMGLGQAAPSFASFSAARGAAPRVYGVIDRRSDIDPFDPEGAKPDNCVGAISFNNVTFNYTSRASDGGEPVIKNLNLKIKPGAMHALVGASGCGKSTAMSLIERFYDVTSGSVCIDGEDVRHLNVRWLRAQMGYVGQMPTLFRATIRENIAFGAPLNFVSKQDEGWEREQISMEQIVEAAKLANAHTFIMSLPEKYETKLGDRGALLSGGQKQRICLARAIVRNPKILLLDEATSALDSRSEHIVQESLDQASAGRTTVVIAHRLSTIRNATSISVFKNGEIVESGTYDELVSRENGVFRELVELQQVKGAKAVSGEEDPDTIHLKALQASASKTESLTMDDNILKDGEIKPDVDPNVISRTFKINASEWPYILFGCIGAAMAGASFPVSAVVFSKVTALLGQQKEKIVMSDIVFWCLMFIVVGVGALIGHVLQYGFLEISGQKLTRKLRSRSFRALLRQEIGYFDREENSVGAVTTRLARDAAQVQGLCGSTLRTGVGFLAALGAGLAVSFIGCWEIALVVLGLLPFMGVAGYVQIRTISGFDSESKKQFISAGSIASEAVDNINTMSPLGIQDTFVERYDDMLKKPLQNGDKAALVAALTFGFSEFYMTALWAVAFWVGSKFVGLGRCKFESIMEGITGLLFAGFTISNVSMFAPDVAGARVSATHVFRLLDRDPEMDIDEGGEAVPSLNGAIALDNAKFEYPSRPDVPVLRQLSVAVQPGKTLALVGSSGCGKSTVVALILRFYDLRRGSLTVDERELCLMNLQQARSHMAFVQQEPDLFDRSIRSNIAYGLSKEDGTPVSQSDIEEAARLANAHEFIMSLPKQYDTEVGERGGHMSGGMKQRIAIARALIRRPKILILDEASSALDAVSERLVQDALDEASKGRTTVIVAHRLSTVKNADSIAVLERGVVVEMGTHEELLVKGGAYAALVSHQMSDENGN